MGRTRESLFSPIQRHARHGQISKENMSRKDLFDTKQTNTSLNLDESSWLDKEIGTQAIDAGCVHSNVDTASYPNSGMKSFTGLSKGTEETSRMSNFVPLLNSTAIIENMPNRLCPDSFARSKGSFYLSSIKPPLKNPGMRERRQIKNGTRYHKSATMKTLSCEHRVDLLDPKAGFITEKRYKQQ